RRETGPHPLSAAALALARVMAPSLARLACQTRLPDSLASLACETCWPVSLAGLAGLLALFAHGLATLPKAHTRVTPKCGTHRGTSTPPPGTPPRHTPRPGRAARGAHRWQWRVWLGCG